MSRWSTIQYDIVIGFKQGQPTWNQTMPKGMTMAKTYYQPIKSAETRNPRFSQATVSLVSNFTKIKCHLCAHCPPSEFNHRLGYTTTQNHPASYLRTFKRCILNHRKSPFLHAHTCTTCAKTEEREDNKDMVRALNGRLKNL